MHQAQSPQLAQMVQPSRSRFATPLWWAMLLFSIGTMGYAAAASFVLLPRDEHFLKYIVPLRLHIAGGIGALLAGPWQFSEKLRARNLNRHRWLGRFYLSSVGLGSVAGFGVALVSKEGLATHVGFGILALFWFFTGLQAYLKVRRGDISAHRRWMIRNFGLTLAAVTLRQYLPLMLFALHWSFRTSYITVSWLCWVPNLIVAEWIARRRI